MPTILVVKFEENKLVARPKHRFVYNIKMYLKEIRYEGVK
jgi:hypothetical protein